ncbi:hypothetical protein [Paraburkholderia phenoliruptrix]|uniref:hypothetical protein n=1 Tax=Paraburkholderia phenoliruptrix TaxID=252970 RepID=UPI0011D26DFD|nr:hypothetical protein [Paraburkholderia phenoliruptrix]
MAVIGVILAGASVTVFSSPWRSRLKRAAPDQQRVNVVKSGYRIVCRNQHASQRGIRVKISVLRDSRLHEIDELRDLRKQSVPIRRQTLRDPSAKHGGKDKIIACVDSASGIAYLRLRGVLATPLHPVRAA